MRAASTIYALASAPGKAGVAVIRISGREALRALVHLGVRESLKPRYATLVTLLSPPAAHHAARILDKALALAFPAPHSFTGEDVLELHLHGGRAVVRAVLEALSTCPGLRMAEPGEFTRRAFLHGKMDLLAAEGLADLIDADSSAQHAQAMRQLGGEMSARLMQLRESILTPLALLEAYIDFPDEEIPDHVLEETALRVEALAGKIANLLDDGHFGERIREGLRIVIFGPPNAGKSSLINALARRDVAIVSEEAGTTRDVIELPIEIGGYAAILTDTAGLREAHGAVEAEGVRRARARVEHADLKIAVFDSVTISQQISDFAHYMDENTIVIANKSDLLSRHPGAGRDPSAINTPKTIAYNKTTIHMDPGLRRDDNFISISVKTGDGIDRLLAQLQEKIEKQAVQAPSPLITRARHREALQQAQRHLHAFQPQAALELNCEELRLAAGTIGKITGKILVDDVLDLVFSRFCIGK